MNVVKGLRALKGQVHNLLYYFKNIVILQLQYTCFLFWVLIEPVPNELKQLYSLADRSLSCPSVL